MRRFLKLVVSHFGTLFSVDDFSFFDRQYQVIWRAAKMLADGDAVFCNTCNFHDVFLLIQRN